MLKFLFHDSRFVIPFHFMILYSSFGVQYSYFE